MDKMTNNKRIAQNTIVLYVRMIFMVIVSLYTSRIVLRTLGVEDFGIYNIAGGIVVLFSFLNSAMISSTQRFLNFELGKKNEAEAARIFSMSINAHVGIMILLFVLSETVGLCFLNTYIQVPPSRVYAMNWVYQMSVLGACLSVIRTPYNAAIIAYEKMSTYAYISIVEVILKLGIVYLLLIIAVDHLIVYSVLTMVVIGLITLCYIFYCLNHFKICHYKYSWDAVLFKRLIGFSGWSLYGSFANMAASQGLNILQNIFFGVSINAAMGIANQVNTAIYNFSSNFQTAFNPQIVKSYAADDRDYFMSLIFKTSKYSFFLLFVLSLPVLICCDRVLAFWLGDVPDHAVEFCRLMILFSLVDGISAPLWMSVQATGRIRNYQIIMGVIIFSNLPLSYIVLQAGANPEAVLVIRVLLNILSFFVRIIYLRKAIALPARKYITTVLFPCLGVAIVAFPLPFLSYHLVDGFNGLIVSLLLAIFLSAFFVYRIGMNRQERSAIKNIIIRHI